MAAKAEASAKQYQGIELLLQQLLDKVSGLESWLSSVDSSLGMLLQNATETAGRVQQLEARPPPPPPPPPSLPPLPRPHQPSPGFPTLDLNTATPGGSHSSTRPPPQTLQELPESLLGPHPRQPVIGIPLDPHSSSMMDAVATQFHLLAPRHGPMPKVDFPKFSGDNPRL
ncbi:unnamed protein product [Miscanthus lutarioriparius]|uniref:Uncharacterized protein n=1 Tax=Miscanthus lutarioriparius TaxID=422564 RepID=A0A811P4K9_9POAL|nr:unnamed protein product [Miscanthus lutarioriparius]